ncbi:plasmid replication protein, CyRepA1 family [Pannus brasiliensis CCIBt3594]|uniref:Plasmid replication protein, CyRepA1 family n=1 Tax=Pannus brasiliensis CCIBt3594 TaxID=1427578 RepID=A0AAW9QVS4_9CHRO
MRWKRFFRGDCPVCEGARKDCRQNPKTGLYHCRDITTEPRNFLFRGYDNLGFGMWADKANVSAWTEEKRREREEERERRSELERVRLDRLLPDRDRDQTIREILGQLTLSPSHRETLRKRGLNDAEIDAGMYRTVDRYQPLRFRVDDRLAGVIRGGKSLYIPAPGILCPIANEKGEFVAWQIRFNDPGDLPRYLWASAEKNRGENGPSVHLKNGELPLSFHAPAGDPHSVIKRRLKDLNGDGTKKVVPIALTEGIAFKPHLTATRLGIHAIGASGGHHATSPKTLETYLKAIEAKSAENVGENGENVTVQPILFADAGCLKNPNILATYENTFQVLEELGHEVRVAWWGQVEKEDGDIDEIDNETVKSIRLLSRVEFDALVKKTERELEVEAVQEKLRGLHPHEPIARFNSRYLPDLTELTDALPSGNLIGIKAPKGCGKSVQIKKIIEKAREKGQKVIAPTPRRALGREQSLKWSMEWSGDLEIDGIDRQTLLENLETLGICWDSLWKLMRRDWSNTLVVFDEVEASLNHLLTSVTCKEKRALLLRMLEIKLRECVSGGGSILFSDADLSAPSIDYFKKLVPSARVDLIVNDYIGEETKFQITYHTGKKDVTIAELMATLATPVPICPGSSITRQPRIAIASDSREAAIALERLIKERFPTLKILRVDSGTTETEEVSAFVENPNEKLLEIAPDVLIYTPSMGAGVSIDVEWFDEVYGFFHGVIEPSQCRQMLSRIRVNVPRVVWCNAHGQLDGNRSFIPEEIKSRLWGFHHESSILIDVAKAMAGEEADDRRLREVYDALWNEKTKSWDNPHLDLYCSIVARKNYGLANLARELRRQLIEEGHRILDRDDRDITDDGARVAEIKKQIPLEEAEAIAAARDIPLDYALSLKQKPDRTEAQQHQITRALLKAELPGVELTSEFVYKVVTKDRRRWLNAVKFFWYCQNPNKTRVIDRREWLNHLHRFIDGAVLLADIRTYSLQARVIKNLRLFELIDLDDPDREYANDGEEMAKILKYACEYRRDLWLAFGLRVTDKTKPCQFVNHLLDRLNLHLMQSRQVNGGRRFYRLDRRLLEDPDRLAVLNSLSGKWEEVGTRATTEDSRFVNEESFEEDLATESGPEDAGVGEAEEAVSRARPSQRNPICINNGARCDAPVRSAPLLHGTSELDLAIAQHSDTGELSGDESSGNNGKESENRTLPSQQSPIYINNGSRCDAPARYSDFPDNTLEPSTDNGNRLSETFTGIAPNPVISSIPIESFPKEHRANILMLLRSLTDAVEDTAESLEQVLDVAVGWFQELPTPREWVSAALSERVKREIALQFPDYLELIVGEAF